MTTEKYTQRKYEHSSLKNKESPEVNHFEEEVEECVESLTRRWREIKEKGECDSRQLSRLNSRKVSRFDEQVNEEDEAGEGGQFEKKHGLFRIE